MPPSLAFHLDTPPSRFSNFGGANGLGGECLSRLESPLWRENIVEELCSTIDESVVEDLCLTGCLGTSPNGEGKPPTPHSQISTPKPSMRTALAHNPCDILTIETIYSKNGSLTSIFSSVTSHDIRLLPFQVCQPCSFPR